MLSIFFLTDRWRLPGAGSTGVFDILPARGNTSSIMVRNAASIMTAGNARLTPKLKRNRTRLRHDPRTTGRISPAWESLRRQMRSGGSSAGSSRALRLDPFALPACFAANDAAADERVRHVELHRERVVVRRCLRGMRMALNMPVSAFSGVSLKLVRAEGEMPAVATVMLEHKDPALALPLFISAEADDAMAEWRVWAPRLGGLCVAPVRPRRRRRGVLAKRRPSILMRRMVRRLAGATPVHHGERE